MERIYARSAAERQADKAKLAIIEKEALAAAPGAAVSADQAYREQTVAIDFCEDVPALDATAVARIVAVFEKHGAVAKVSSIHVNGWFGALTSHTTSRRFLKESFGINIDAAPESVVFAGDSPNDAPMFGFFPNAVGVANVLAFKDRMAALPAYVTPSTGGSGFAELAAHLLQARG